MIGYPMLKSSLAKLLTTPNQLSQAFLLVVHGLNVIFVFLLKWSKCNWLQEKTKYHVVRLLRQQVQGCLKTNYKPKTEMKTLA